MRIAVAGGTGWVGRLVVDEVRRRGHDPVVLARSTGVDLTTGAGVAEAVAGTGAIIDVANVTTQSRAESVAFFEKSTSVLLDAAGDRHYVALSIVGVDRVGLGYYAGKVRQEELALTGSAPATVLRATQFHEFAAQMLERLAFGPFAPVPAMLAQPIAAAEVATFLVDAALGAPRGLAPEVAGPERLRMPDMVRMLIRRRRGRKIVVPVRLPGAAGKAMAAGGLLPLGEGPRGVRTYGEWLASA